MFCLFHEPYIFNDSLLIMLGDGLQVLRLLQKSQIGNLRLSEMHLTKKLDSDEQGLFFKLHLLHEYLVFSVHLVTITARVIFSIKILEFSGHSMISISSNHHNLSVL